MKAQNDPAAVDTPEAIKASKKATPPRPADDKVYSIAPSRDLPSRRMAASSPCR